MLTIFYLTFCRFVPFQALRFVRSPFLGSDTSLEWAHSSCSVLGLPIHSFMNLSNIFLFDSSSDFRIFGDTPFIPGLVHHVSSSTASLNSLNRSSLANLLICFFCGLFSACFQSAFQFLLSALLKWSPSILAFSAYFCIYILTQHIAGNYVTTVTFININNCFSCQFCIK